MIKTFNNLILKNILKILTYFLSFPIPKNHKIWVFGGWFGERFADNSRYFYQYVSMNREQLGLDKVIWITRNKKIILELRNQGYEVYHVWSLKSIWYHLRSPIFIYDQSLDDLNPFFLHRGILLYLWHGFPLKKIGTYTRPSKDHRFLKYYMCAVRTAEYILPGLNIRYGGKNSFLLAQSEFASEILCNALNLQKEVIIFAGYPRDDILTNEKKDEYYLSDEQKTIDAIKRLHQLGNKIIFYTPTFRDKVPTLFFGTENLEEIRKLRTFLLNNNFVLITKFHFAAKASNIEPILENESHYFNLDPDVDIYPILPLTDILITDYSSIAFDFLFLNRPIIFFPYDLEYYRDHDRGLIFDYEEYTPGPKAYDLSDLMRILKEISDGTFCDIYLLKRRLLLEKIHDLKYHPGSPILAKKIKNILQMND